MKICMDIQAAIGPGAGIGRYTRELLAHVGAHARAGERLAAFYFDFHRRGYSGPAPQVAIQSSRLPGRIVQKVWKTIHAPPYACFAGAADLYHFPNFVIPPLRKKDRAVVSIHDVSFLRLPETTEEKNLAWLTSEIPATVRRADAIITISDFSKREICECLNVPAEKIHVTHLGLSQMGADLVSAEEESALRRNLGITKPYWLMVGTIEPRKNIPFLFRLMEHMSDWDGDLVLAGGLGWKTDAIIAAMKQSACASRIHYVSRVGDRELSTLYAGAAAFIFPSFYEGFGFPPLEALARGTPVVSARNSSLPEVLGDAAAWVDGYALEDWQTAIRAILNENAAAREARARRGREQAAAFTWDKTAAETWKVYRHVLGT